MNWSLTHCKGLKVQNNIDELRWTKRVNTEEDFQWIDLKWWLMPVVCFKLICNFLIQAGPACISFSSSWSSWLSICLSHPWPYFPKLIGNIWCPNAVESNNWTSANIDIFLRKPESHFTCNFIIWIRQTIWLLVQYHCCLTRQKRFFLPPILLWYCTAVRTEVDGRGREDCCNAIWLQSSSRLYFWNGLWIFLKLYNNAVVNCTKFCCWFSQKACKLLS